MKILHLWCSTILEFEEIKSALVKFNYLGFGRVGGLALVRLNGLEVGAHIEFIVYGVQRC